MFGRHKQVRQPHLASNRLSRDADLMTSPDLSSSMPKRWTRVHQLLHDNHGVRYFVMAVTLVIATGLILLSIISGAKEPSIAKVTVPKPTPEAPKFYSPLTGAETTETLTKRPVTAIMIENSTDARPQSGLKDAGIVYEAVAEGGITRFVALYQESRPGLVGPIRSVRPYYVEWASAYDPAIAHVGGSYRARQMASSGMYGVDMDQFFNGSSYWRTNDREPPHNVYTNFDKLDTLREKKGKTASTFTGFTRIAIPKKNAPKTAVTTLPAATTIDIGVSSGAYAVHYDYDATSGTYPRSHNGVAHTDREGGRLAPTVVVAIKVNEFTALEGTDGYREQITTTGSGQAYVFQQGTVIEATWSRDSEKSPLVLRDGAGVEIALARGQTWITALSNTKSVSWQ